MTYSHTVIAVKGLAIRNALRNIFRGAEGFTLTADESVEVCWTGISGALYSSMRLNLWSDTDLEGLAG